MNGALTNPNVQVFCYAAAQVQKVMDVSSVCVCLFVCICGIVLYFCQLQVDVYDTRCPSLPTPLESFDHSSP
jgi:xylose isomerase